MNAGMTKDEKIAQLRRRGYSEKRIEQFMRDRQFWRVTQRPTRYLPDRYR